MASASSPSQLDAQTALLQSSEAESQLSSIVYGMSQQVQIAMENMLKMITEIDQNSSGVVEEIDKCKNAALERKKGLEEERNSFRKLLTLF